LLIKFQAKHLRFMMKNVYMTLAKEGMEDGVGY
jgi:hypothetical protein